MNRNIKTKAAAAQVKRETLTCWVYVLLVLAVLEAVMMVVKKVQVTNPTTVVAVQTPAVCEHSIEKKYSH